MNNLLVQRLETIQNDAWKSFAFRMYNTFKSIILPIALSLTLIQLQNHPNDLTCLLEGQFWMNMAYAIVVALVGSAIAGLDKVHRM